MIYAGTSSLLRRTALAAARAPSSQAPASLAIVSTSFSASSSIIPAFSFGGSIQTRNSTKRGGGSTKNNRNSPGKRLGYKKQTGTSLSTHSSRSFDNMIDLYTNFVLHFSCSSARLPPTTPLLPQVKSYTPVRSSTGSVVPPGTQAPMQPSAKTIPSLQPLPVTSTSTTPTPLHLPHLLRLQLRLLFLA